MKTLIVLAAVAALALVPTAHAKVLKTNWVERYDFANGKGFARVYVRKIEVTRTTWKAWVGLTNKSTMRVKIAAKQRKEQWNSVYSFWAGPGLWWTTREAGGNWWPDAGTSVTHSVRAAKVAPAYASALGPGKSWFGTFSGQTAKLSKDRLLRIGFGVLQYDSLGVTPQGEVIPRELVLSTTHQFKLPRV